MLKNATELRDCREQLKVWDEAMTCCQDLVTVIKAQDTKLNLRVFLKGSLPILRLFLSQGMSVCSVMFKMESQVVPQLLKKLQVVTRYIQTVCNYSKVSKDSLIIQQLPVVRGLLENILLSVKNMVVRNKCTDAFFMGSMKNKDLKGEVIHSQVRIFI
ncbi:hypothetical protein AAG570_006202 [Ranatra chinensis]|uniref:Uncharacterized protein n=1 Tax=Ranatra chinensis TaxID=642074 RepID=A0ABD0XXP1_9HEMI